jgi:hypothetical protein
MRSKNLAKEVLVSVSLVRFPGGSVVCRYAPVSGGVAVVAVSGVVLGPSFFAIRSRWSFVCAVSGAGGWVVLAPAVPAVPASQPVLF